MIAGKVRSLPKSGEPERHFTQVGNIAFLANKRLRWKGLTRTNPIFI
jgi:hypothetical protein